MRVSAEREKIIVAKFKKCMANIIGVMDFIKTVIENSRGNLSILYRYVDRIIIFVVYHLTKQVKPCIYIIMN